MIKPALMLTAASLVLASCGTVRESRFNPLNWFGSSTSEPAPAAAGGVNPLIPQRRASILRNDAPEVYLGDRVAQVTELLIERRPGGAIIRATGIAANNGPFDVRMIPVESAEPGELSYELSARQIPGQQGTVPSRTVTAGVWITDQDLAGIRVVRVLGQQNARAVRR